MGIGLGSILGGVVGGVAGFVGTGFNPVGAAAGFSVGSAIGGQFDSEDVQGPGGDPLRAAQLEEARRQQAEWDKVYGPVQEELARNLRNMSLASVSALGLEGVEQEFESVGIKIRQSVAQRGLEGSGIEQEFAKRNALQAAEAKAKIRADAPARLEASQRNFLNLGLSQKDRPTLVNTLLGQQANAADIREATRLRETQRDQAQFGETIGAGAQLLGGLDFSVPDINLGEDAARKPQAPNDPVLRTDGGNL